MSANVHKRLTIHVQHAKVGLHHDGGVLYLQVVESKGKEPGKLAKSWVFKYRSGKRIREMGLGSLKVIVLKDARERAAYWRKVRARQAAEREEDSPNVRTVRHRVYGRT